MNLPLVVSTLVVLGLAFGLTRHLVKLVYLAKLLRPGFFLMHLVASWMNPSASCSSRSEIRCGVKLFGIFGLIGIFG